MDLADIRQQILSSNTSAREKAEALLLERTIYALNRKEWHELLAGIPADVKRQVGMLMSADTVVDMSTQQEVTVQIEDGREYPATLFGGRLDVDVLKDQLAQDGLILSKLDGKVPYRNGDGLSRTVFTATIIKAQTVRHPANRRSCVDALSSTNVRLPAQSSTCYLGKSAARDKTPEPKA